MKIIFYVYWVTMSLNFWIWSMFPYKLLFFFMSIDVKFCFCGISTLRLANWWKEDLLTTWSLCNGWRDTAILLMGAIFTGNLLNLCFSVAIFWFNSFQQPYLRSVYVCAEACISCYDGKSENWTLGHRNCSSM